MQHDIGMVGLGTMGRNLILNMADHGFSVAGLATSEAKAKKLESYAGPKQEVVGFSGIEEFVAALRKPRAVFLLVPAGDPVDAVIANLVEFLEPGDLIVDGGNSYFKDTDRRHKQLAEKGFGYIGIGVSGGESGARHGPSMMAGGDPKSYDRVKPILEAASAKADGEPCVKLLGAGAAGHYVKMVHNGIEYGLMQMIAEVYDLLHRGAGRPNGEIAALFEKWNASKIGGFLIQITSEVLRYKEGDAYLVDLVQDAAKQKGTGKWTSQDAMDLPVPIPTIDAAVSARDLSTLKSERGEVGAALGVSQEKLSGGGLDEALTAGMGAAIVLAYAQGFQQLRAASAQYQFGLNLVDVASVWREGCIIRSELLKEFTRAFRAKPDLENILLDGSIGMMAMEGRQGLVSTIGSAMAAGIPTPSLMASLAYLDGIRSPRLPANLIQAQRDYFGAHTYERIDQPGVFHTEWGSQG